MENQNVKTEEESAAGLCIRYKSLKIKRTYSVTLGTKVVEAQVITTMSDKVELQYMEEIDPRMVKASPRIVDRISKANK